MCIGLTSSCYRSVLERNEVEKIERNGGSPQRGLLEKKWDCVQMRAGSRGGPGIEEELHDGGVTALTSDI